MNRTRKLLQLVALGGLFFLTPAVGLAQNSCRVQAVFVRPTFVRPAFDRANLVHSTIDRASLERASLEKPDIVRASFERPNIIRPVFDDPCRKQAESGRSTSRATYTSILDFTGEKDSKLAQNGKALSEFPRHGVVLAARAKSNDTTAVGECCGQVPVNRDQQHRLYR